MTKKTTTKRGPNRLSQAENIRHLFAKYPKKTVSEIAEIAGVKYQIAYMVRRDAIKRAEKLKTEKPSTVTVSIKDTAPMQIEMFEPAGEPSALDVQVGGNHYKNMVIQPVEFCEKNKLSHLESNIVKRISRWRSKDGLKDLEKIKHEVDLLIELNGLRNAK